MRRVLFSLLVVGVVFAIAYGAAASLTVNGGVVQAGDNSSLTCDSAVNVSYTLAFDSGAFKVTAVTVSDIDANCAGKTVAVQLTKDGSAISGASGTATLPSDFKGGSVTVNLNTPAKAADVNDVHVAIYTPPSS